MLQTALATPRQRLTSPDAVPLHRPRCLARPEEGLLRYPRQALLALPLPRGALHSLALFLLMHLTDWCPRVPASVSLRSTMPDRYPLTVQQSNIPFNPLTKFFAVRYWTFMGEPLQQAGWDYEANNDAAVGFGAPFGIAGEHSPRFYDNSGQILTQASIHSLAAQEGPVNGSYVDFAIEEGITQVWNMPPQRGLRGYCNCTKGRVSRRLLLDELILVNSKHQEHQHCAWAVGETEVMSVHDLKVLALQASAD